MDKCYHVAAIDLGASSGRIILGSFDGTELKIVDEYRMENGFINIEGNFYWDVLGLYKNIILGLRYFKNKGIHIDSVGVNTWGVDFVLLGAEGRPLGFPRCYRDERNRAAFKEVSEIILPKEFYQMTGIIPDPINSVYQFYAASKDDCWKSAKSFLFMPDFFVYLMTGNTATESSIASTAQMIDRNTGDFHEEILEKLGLQRLAFPRLLKKPGVRGTMTKTFAEQAGCGGAKVMNINSHDTGSAISLAEALPENELLMNSGTIAIISSIQEKPFITDYSFENGVTNEMTLDGRYRPARNMNGMFMINQCREWWKLEGKNYSWSDVTDMAAKAAPFRGRIDIADPRFMTGGNVPAILAEYCKEKQIPVPETDGEVARMIYESMAAAFADSIRVYEKAGNKSFDCLNIVGGGSKNQLLNQMIANAAQKKIKTGITEATAFGNMLTQLEGAGELTHEDSLKYIKGTFHGTEIQPESEGGWKEFG